MEKDLQHQTTQNTDTAPEPQVHFTMPLSSGTKTISISAGKFKALAGVCALLVVALAGTAGYFGYDYYKYRGERAAYAEYKAHKAEQDAQIQSLLEDNEKMLRDMSEIHTLETKLRRAVIHNSEDKDFTTNLEKTNSDTKATDPNYMGKGGPGSADSSMVAVVQAQNKNLTHQIDEQKTNMNELLSTLEGRNNKRSAFPDLWPTEGGTVSSNYGSRVGPIEGGYDWHPGVDIAVDFGTPVYASAMGTVEIAGWNGGYGRYVKINHGNGYESAYGHMSGIVVAPGQEVRKGEIIGFVGSSGYSTGPHVHFEVLVDGQTIDPMYMLNLGKETNK
jgi:murein DD-endopeptidase MepM/ murein hydrolase activator NlpD